MITPVLADAKRGILFKPFLGEAIHIGRKTQTRRRSKLEKCPADFLDGDVAAVVNKTTRRWGISRSALDRRGSGFWPDGPDLHGVGVGIACPYGAVGDVLYVREAFQVLQPHVEDGSVFATDLWTGKVPTDACPAGWKVWHRGRDADVAGDRLVGKWRPGVHMPRWAARSLLTLTSIRVERLQALSESDAEAEGVCLRPAFDATDLDYVPDGDVVVDLADHLCHRRGAGNGYKGNWGRFEPANRLAFATLVDQINGAGTWAANAWVWALTFTVTKIGAQP